jgi:heme exporter protein D
MERIAAFLDMGGYAAFVWPAYLICAALLIGLLVVSLRGLRAHEGALKSLQSSMPHRGAGARARKGSDRR